MTLPLKCWAGALVLALSPGLVAQAPSDEARPRDLQTLQQDLANLDADLQALDTADEHTEELRQRADEIRENTIYLKVKMQRHQAAGEPGTGVDFEEVEDLRRAVADLREDLDRFFVSAQDRHDRHRQELRLSEGTRLVVRLEEPLSSKTAQREDRFDASVVRPVRADGVLAIPAGTHVRGIVRFAEPAQRPAKGGQLDIDFDALYIDHMRLDLHTRVASLQEPDSPDAASKAGLGAVLGSVLGGILGGRKGALIGTLVGLGGGLAASKGDDVELPAGTVLTVRLERPLVVPR